MGSPQMNFLDAKVKVSGSTALLIEYMNLIDIERELDLVARP